MKNLNEEDIRILIRFFLDCGLEEEEILENLTIVDDEISDPQLEIIRKLRK